MTRIAHVTMPVEAAAIHWLALLNLARSKVATYPMRERAKTYAAAYQAIMNGKSEAVITKTALDEEAARLAGTIKVPPANDAILYRADYTRNDLPVDNADSRYEAPSAWALVELVKSSNMPLPPGIAQWLYHARMGERLKASDKATGLVCSFSILEVR